MSGHATQGDPRRPSGPVKEPGPTPAPVGPPQDDGSPPQREPGDGKPPIGPPPDDVPPPKRVRPEDSAVYTSSCPIDSIEESNISNRLRTERTNQEPRRWIAVEPTATGVAVHAPDFYVWDGDVGCVFDWVAVLNATTPARDLDPPSAASRTRNRRA